MGNCLFVIFALQAKKKKHMCMMVKESGIKEREREREREKEKEKESIEEERYAKDYQKMKTLTKH